MSADASLSPCRRMSMIMRRQNKLPEAEQYLRQALAIREEKLVRVSPVGIAYTLVQLATIEELRGKCDGEVEQRLMRALEIFGRVKGTHRLSDARFSASV